MNPDDRKYSKEHEWIKVDGEEAIIGITDHAQKELGDITFVELPALGQQVPQEDTLATVESVKAASDIYAPIAIEVTAINATLEETPEIINKSPFDEGWICRGKILEPATLEGLMDASAYSSMIEG
jgi:glycine cleavage system H protein